ncbi:MAG TPA: aspartate aminotransferase family protein, partial [Clostridiales bacterium]|nr:aspartate aminotransferase family protein [Clostridiales bacterium]
KEKSNFIRRELTGVRGVKSVSGLGLMLGVETEKDAGEIIRLCMDQGVLVIKAKNKIRLLPALNIPWDLLKRALSVLKEACATET